MITCPKCGAVHVANTLICSQCSTLLITDSQVTDPVAHEEVTRVLNRLDQLDHVQYRTATEPAVLPDTTPLAILLKIGPHRREVELPLRQTIHLGRKDPKVDVYPEVDLSNDGDSARAVSRRHARIFKQEDKVVVEDLRSTNGTFVNGRKLHPLTCLVLHDGDLVQLGTLQIEVRIRRQ
jgi:hypothetical protein